MARLRECRAADARSEIIAESRSFSVLRQFSEFSLEDLNARDHANSTSTLRVFPFMAGFSKGDCVDLALSRRRFAGIYEEQTAAAARCSDFSRSIASISRCLGGYLKGTVEKKPPRPPAALR
jgi:hypothetical protein